MKFGTFLEPHPKLKTLIQGAALLAIALAPSLAQADQGYSKSYDNRGYSHGSPSPSRGNNISALNYALSSTLKANSTYTGVVVNVQPVTVKSYRQGLVPLLVTGVFDTVAGTHSAEQHQAADQLTIRMANPRPHRAEDRFQFITVIQAPGNVRAGQEVLIVTEQMRRDCAQVRVSPFHNPNLVHGQGVIERMQDPMFEQKARENAFRREQQVLDAENNLRIRDMAKAHTQGAPTHAPDMP